ncbi:hypothetical protein ACMA1I_16740 [Pontibacter sp. 13R65]|uniref:hypothetical protein n=1 Tax=Pontibacter sp. 13R65 TaxID=3127458 RepID=UPI00301CE008
MSQKIVLLHPEMLNLKNIRYLLRYPLMAVMLLWALTLPGQEVEVYSFLVKTAASSTSHCQPTASTSAEHKGNPVVEQQAVHAFQDAKTSSVIVVGLQQAAVHNPLLLLVSFTLAANRLLPERPVAIGGAQPLTSLLAVVLQPNAP